MKIASYMRALEAALRHPVRAYGLLLVLGALTWAGVIHSGHVNYDTAWLWRDNLILSSGDLSWLPDIWSNFNLDVRQVLGAEYLPIRDTNTLIDFKLFGENWTIHHGANLVWYLAACTLFLGICRHLLGAGPPAWVAAAWFTVHPIHTENVAWLAGRKDLLGLALAMGAWWLWLHKTRNQKFSTLAFLLFIFSVWSKNTYIILPAILVLCDVLIHHQHPWRRKGQWFLWAGITAPLVLLSVQLGQTMRLFGEKQHASTLEGLSMQAQLWARDLAHLAWPSDLAMAYPTPTSALSLSLLGAAVLLAALLVAAWRLRRRAPVLSLGIGIFFLASLPTTIFMSLQNLAADRYLLLPSAGIALALGAALNQARTDRQKRWLSGLSLTVLASLAFLSTQQSQHWRSDLALWSASAQHQPTVLQNVLRHARALSTGGRPAAALNVLQDAEDRFGQSAQFFQGRGVVHFRSGDPNAAEQDYRQALDLDPDLRISGNDLAVILSKSGRLEEAVLVATRMTHAHPRYAKGFNTLGALLLNARLLDRAETALLRAELLSFEDPSTACNLGGVYWLKMQTDPAARPAAIQWWTTCKKRKPDVVTPPGLDLRD